MQKAEKFKMQCVTEKKKEPKAKDVTTIEATEAAALVISSASYILKYTILTMSRASLFAD